MKLQAKVIRIESGGSYKDNLPRVTIRIEGGETMYCSFMVANEDNFALDDELEVTVEQRVVGDPSQPAPWEAQDGSLDIS